eukprot:gene913-540_t
MVAPQQIKETTCHVLYEGIPSWTMAVKLLITGVEIIYPFQPYFSMASCNFKNQLTGEVHIRSAWEKEVITAQAGTQTTELKTSEAGTQTKTSSIKTSEKLEKGEGHDRAQLAEASLQGGLQYVYSKASYDEEKLAAFVESSEQFLLSVLHKNSRTNIFDGYHPNWTKRSSELTCVYTMSFALALEHGLHALDVSWNSTGTMLAVAYGRLDASGWCNTSGYVCIWNIARPDFDQHSPHFTLETDTYATKVQFHPSQALMLAIGTYSGDLIVYPNITENQFFSSSQGKFSHRDPISSIEWVQNLQETRESYRFALCVGSQDCSISLWSITNKLKLPIGLFQIRNKRHQTTGVSAVTYARSAGPLKGGSTPSMDSAIIVGLESGDVGRGRTGLLAADPVEDEEEAKPLKAIPLALDWVENHWGPVQSIQSSPFFRHLFLSCSSDGTARLYHLMETHSQLTLEPSSDTKHFLYGAQFSPFRPSVLALVSRSSYLHIYDLQKSKAKPLYSTEAGIEGAPVVCVKFCTASADWVATGDTRGNARIWTVPTELTQQTESERAAVRTVNETKREGAGDGTNDPGRELFGFSLYRKGSKGGSLSMTWSLLQLFFLLKSY